MLKERVNKIRLLTHRCSLSINIIYLHIINKIKINNMKFHSYIGVYQEEKKIGQNIEIDLIISLSKKIIKDDDITSTLSYGDCYRKIKEIVKASNVDLLETLALEIIEEIKKLNDKIESVQVNIRKLAVPINGIFDSVEIQIKD